ncbi:periplasmic heavy metal sensor [Zhongshania aliphaticivorans]|uniref:periplasmic heavy metal sensor n=1 Tax=Zhongshania aliphaticivorans TaxID=1470434 RepID=UPI0012E4A98F|nr:periplasmic heavy metal sensor [Zhongshania aliphaticivorans]CAA0097741.1 Uncharacterised protein [Zhongshania aliphaticivorans]
MSVRKGVVIALFVSLVLNGVLLGLYAGHRLMGEERHAMHGMAKQLLKDEPKELAEPMRQVLEMHRKDMARAYRKLRSAKRDMVDILKQDSATEVDIKSGFKAIRIADNNLKQVSHEVLATVLATLPPEQRLKFALRELGRMQKKPPRPDSPDRNGERPPR